MQAHNDEPTLIDELGRQGLVAEVGEVVASSKPPLVVGIHGDWGLGKTSFLNRLQLYLTAKCSRCDDADVKRLGRMPGSVRTVTDDVRVVWFEAWRYQNEAAPVVALLYEIRAQLTWYQKAYCEAGKLAAVATRGALNSMEDITKKIGIQASKIDAAGKRWEEEHLASALPSNTIREQLQAAIALLLRGGLKDKERRLVVLVDDLDRCDPAAAYKLLEGLKLYLTLENCVFVVGMNQQIVEDAIGQQVPGADAGVKKERAAAYLEKLCHNVWRLPSVRDPLGYLFNLLGANAFAEDVRNAFPTAAPNEPSSRASLPRNPRRLKGLANLLLRFQPLLPVGAGLLDVQRMLIVALVYQFHHDLYRRWEAHPDLYRRISEWCHGTDPGQLPSAPASAQQSAVQSATAQRADPVDEIFRRLSRVVNVEKDLSAASPTYKESNAFPDPADASVFWAQPLVLASEADTRVIVAQDQTYSHFVPYLSEYQTQ